MTPKKPDAVLVQDLTFSVGPYKQRQHKLDNGESTIPTLLKVLMYPELLRGECLLVGTSLNSSTKTVP